MISSKGFNLFIVSAILVSITFLFATFWDLLQLGENKIPLAIVITVSFGISLAGLILGAGEVKINKYKKNWIGILGNSGIVLLFISILIYAINL